MADELTRALLVIALADQAGIERFVYFSMMNADVFSDTPHAAAKYSAEQAITKLGMPTSILRSNYFYQNDVKQKGFLTAKSVYAIPIGVTMVDTRDIAETTALELIRRERSSDPLPTEVIEIVGPEMFTGDSIAGLWSDILDKPIRYAGDDLRPVEEMFRKQVSKDIAYDNTLMFRGFQREGMLGAPGAADRLAGRLGRPLRTYRAFAQEQAVAWNKPLLGNIADEVLPGADR